MVIGARPSSLPAIVITRSLWRRTATQWPVAAVRVRKGAGAPSMLINFSERTAASTFARTVRSRAASHKVTAAREASGHDERASSSLF
jgi:hypothetical protein